MPDQNRKNLNQQPVPVEELGQKAVDLYNRGTNCDKAILLVFQEIFKLSPEKWDYKDFYGENPDADRFLCKALAAGAISIYLQVIDKMNSQRPGAPAHQPEPIERVNHIFNKFLEESGRQDLRHPADFDPFEYDQELEGIPVDAKLKMEYAQRVKALFAAFEKQFGVCNCQDILGFDPFSYDSYDQKMQEYIEGGEWMQKCDQCMKFLIKSMA